MAQVALPAALLLAVLGSGPVHGAEPADAAPPAAAPQQHPGEAPALQRLSQAYAMDNEPVLALAAIQAALALDPGNIAYLRAQGELALWNERFALATTSLRAVLAADPRDAGALRMLAQSQSRAGRLDAAVESYERHEALQPGETGARLDHARVQLYPGDYRAARVQLERYRAIAGTTTEYQKVDAEFCARAGCPSRALEDLEPLLAEQPHDYDLNLIRTLALNARRERGPALDSLRTLDALGPQRPETTGAHLQVGTPLRTHAAAIGEVYDDSDGLTIQRGGLRTVWVPLPATRVTVQADAWELRADAGSGLEDPNSDESRSISGIQAHWFQQLLPSLALELGAGELRTDPDVSIPQYSVGAQWWPSDSLWLAYSRSRELLLASPRTVALGIERDGNRLDVEWHPALRAVVVLAASVDSYSDGNDRLEAVLAPRIALLRTEAHVLDVGVRAQWLRFDTDFEHGYYDPRDFQRYAMAGYYYWKASEDAGVGVVLGAGADRDTNSDADFQFSGDARAEGVLGIFRSWQMRGHAAYGGRQDSAAGGYNGHSFGLELTRRF